MHRPSRLRVCPGGRRLLREDGSPFFYLADTAWELFHLLTQVEIHHYLKLRASQQFTVIQAVVLAEFDGVATPNARGDLPFAELLPTNTLASVLPSGQPVQAMISGNKKYALVYFPSPGTRSVQLSQLSGETFSACWHDPRTGKRTEAGSVRTCDFMEWSPLARGEDWVLVLQGSS